MEHEWNDIVDSDVPFIEATYGSTPEQRLASAVLEGAFDELVAGWPIRDVNTIALRRNKTLAHRALAWFFSGDHSSVYAFENVCDHLSLSESRLRSRLYAWCRENAPTDRLTFDAFWSAFVGNRATQDATFRRYFPVPSRDTIAKANAVLTNTPEPVIIEP